AIVSPYLQFSLLSKNKRLQYTTWHTKLMHGVTKDDRLPTGESSESLFYWMRARFNHLSYNLGRVQLGLFEATMFRNISTGGVQPFNAMELNPVIGLNTAVFGFKAANKTLVGLDVRMKVTRRSYVYGQFATDGPSRYGWQAGIRAFDVLRRDLHVQLEYNAATPFMYMSSPVRQAYVQAGQPLAHPRGNAFNEVVGIIDAGFGRYWLQCKVNVAVFDKDTSDTYNDGNDLNKPDESVPSPNGALSHRLFNMDVNASYLLNPNTNLRFVFGCMRRDLSNSTDGAQSTYIYIAFRTNLFNRYYDL
ncbi:MAG TPA: hypothetical protein PK760_07080, partial [Flavobacteriales bacterium]|nr:hypothetical protein [Flavobacteriales bacterium]